MGKDVSGKGMEVAASMPVGNTLDRNLKRRDAATPFTNAQGRRPITGAVDRLSSFAADANSSLQGKISNWNLGVNIVGKLKGVEGGSSNCRDEDLQPPLPSESGGKELQAAAFRTPCSGAHKVYGEKPERLSGNGSVQENTQQPLMTSAIVHSCCKQVAALLRSDHSQLLSPALFSALAPVNAAALGHQCIVAPAEVSLKQNTSNDDAFGKEPSAVYPNTWKSYAAAVNCGGSADQHISGPVPSNINLDVSYNLSSKSFHDGTAELSALGQLLEMDGRKVVSFSNAEFYDLVTPFRYSLVGKFSHGFPSMKTLRLVLGNLKLKDAFSVSLLEEKHVLIRLSCEEDYSRLWCRQNWHIAGYPMRVFKWTPDFSPQFESPYAPIWVLFPYLPVHLFDKRSLLTIASSLGTPLRIDSATASLTRASVARVCIELDVSKNLLPEVEIHIGGESFLQPVEYEKIPKYCDLCKHLGHSSDKCLTFKCKTGTQADKAEGTEPAVAEPTVLAACPQPIQVQTQPSAIIPIAPLTGAGMIIHSLPEAATQQFEKVPSSVVIAGSNISKDFDGQNLDIPESSKCREYMIQSNSSHKAAGDQSWPSSPRSYDPDEVAIYLDDNNGELHLIDHQTLEISCSPNRGGAIDDLSENYSSKIDRAEDWKKWKGKKNEPLTSRSIEEMEEKPPDEGERDFKVVSKKKGRKKK